MSDQPTPETDACWDSTTCNILEHAKKLERQRDEARELARELLNALKDQHNFSRHFSNSGHNSRFAKMQRDTEALLAKAKEVLP